MAEEVVGVGDKAFRTRLPVSRNQANKPANKSQVLLSRFFKLFP